MKKIALFAFNGDPDCFVHVLLNAVDMRQRGDEAKIVIEGAATALLPVLALPEHPLNRLWEQAKADKLIEGVCKACANKTQALRSANAQDIRLLMGMSGHPSMAWYLEAGYEIITF